MATYKVIQDVEAEDKLLGPLSLRQFIYAAIAVICFYLSYFVATHSAAFLMALLLPVAFVSGFFAFPWGRDQPTEIWALAKIRFFLKPRKRIWDQSGIKELVTITAPKQVQTNFTNGLTETEVQSRLHALADTIDSRGWAIKNTNLNYQQTPLTMAEPVSDRLVNASSLPQPVASVDVQASDDMLDERNNPDAQRVNTMIAAADKAHRQKIVTNLQQDTPQLPAQPTDALTGAQRHQANYWFLNQPMQPAAIPSDQVTFNTQVVTPGMPEEEIPNAPGLPTTDEQNLVAQLATHKNELPNTAYYGHLHTVLPLSAQAHMPQQAQAGSALQPGPGPQQAGAANTAWTAGQPLFGSPAGSVPNNGSQTPYGTTPAGAPPAQPSVTPAVQAAILQLSKNNDLNVATIAREAERSASQDEVVIKLH